MVLSCDWNKVFWGTLVENFGSRQCMDRGAVGDFLSKALAGLLPGVVALHGRGLDLLLVACFLLVPLSLLKDLALLRFSSLAGLGATLYGFLLLASDCATNANIMDPAGHVMKNLFPLRVDFFSALAICSSAFMAHYNSPKFYGDLQERSLPRFAKLVRNAFGLAFIAFAIFGFCGFALFGFEVQGNVLTNYGGGTPVMLAWLGMAFSVIFTYPLVFSTLRDSVAALLGRAGIVQDASSSSFRVPFTVAAVATTVVGGTILNNVAVVNGVKGAVMSACLAFVYPALLHLKLSKPKSPAEATPATKIMRLASYALIVIGVASGIMALLAMFVLPKTDFKMLAEEVAR